SRVVERALYDPEAGFYEVGGRSGRREGHFVTSPEVGALFGAVVARMLDEQWRALGEPPVFVVVEPGAGPGTLCRTVLAATPACSPALRYVLVERSAAQRRLHAERLRLEDPALAFPPVDPDTEVPVAEAPEGPICVSLAAMPRLPGPAVVLANELLDNLPFGLAERRGGSWCEVRVDLEPGGAGTDGGTRLVERLVPFADDTAALLERLAPGAAEGAGGGPPGAARARCPPRAPPRPGWGGGRGVGPGAPGRRCGPRPATGCGTRWASPGPAVGSSCSTTSARRPRWPHGPSRSGSAPTGGTGGAGRPSPTSAPRTSPARWRSTSSPWCASPTPAPPRPSGCGPTASTSWSRRPAGPGGSGPTSATWPPSRPAAG